MATNLSALSLTWLQHSSTEDEMKRGLECKARDGDKDDSNKRRCNIIRMKGPPGDCRVY